MCHVLIIEDEPFIALHLGELVSRWGASSFSFAETERTAIEQARAQRPGLILSDVRLAEGNGPAATRAIITELGPVPIIFITGTPHDCEDCAHASAILPKPFLTGDLQKAFTAALLA